MSERKRGRAGTGVVVRGGRLVRLELSLVSLTTLIQNICPHLYLPAPHLRLDVKVRWVAWTALFNPAHVSQ